MKITEFFEENLGKFEFDPQIVHHFSDGLYAKQMFIPAGFMVISHSHAFSHFSILAKGRVIVKTDDYTNEYAAPACIEIKNNVHHQIEALEDAVWYCIHATDEKDVNKVDQVLIGKD